MIINWQVNEVTNVNCSVHRKVLVRAGFQNRALFLFCNWSICSSSHFLPTYQTLSHVICNPVLWFHLIWGYIMKSRYIMNSVVTRRTCNLEVGGSSPTLDIR
uniref:Uncharacterized protein n=1 Tax=Cacopsylla melanoneura TaxID=428564 RepID=A0A8D8RE15_9HEMI